MCTVTWMHDVEGYHVFFNRDELRSRKDAVPPEIKERGDVRYLSPTDADAGGTWIATNEYGLTVGLVNYYPPEPSLRITLSDDDDFVSRGQLVASVADCADTRSVLTRLKRQDLEVFRPFLLFIVSPRSSAASATWDSRELEERRPVQPPVTTSGYEAGDVVRHRTALYREMVTQRDGPTPELLRNYHRSQIPEAGPYAVAMEHEVAQTVSMTYVRVTATEIVYEYTPGNPAHAEPLPPVRLARRGTT